MKEAKPHFPNVVGLDERFETRGSCGDSVTDGGGGGGGTPAPGTCGLSISMLESDELCPSSCLTLWHARSISRRSRSKPDPNIVK